MKKIGFIAALLLGMAHAAGAQAWHIDVAYQYLSARQWNEAVQTYNFSRPFLPERQPLLASGAGVAVGYRFTISRRVQHGVQLAYAHFRSASENVDFENTLNLHFVQLGYLTRYPMTEQLYLDLVVSAKTSGLFRNINGEPLEDDEARSYALGIGADLTLGAGYRIRVGADRYVVPFVAVSYTPYLYAPNVEPVINQTKRLVGGGSTTMAVAQVGVRFEI